MNMKRIWSQCVAAVVLAVLCSCEGVFDTHPYDMNFKGQHDINATNIARIEALCKGRDTLRIAFISDTHAWYTETEAEVADINRRDDVDFVVHLGDLTDSGTRLEYNQARKYLGALNKPYVALIGNHDFLGTGEEGYEWMYGRKNFSFIVCGIKFVCLDTNAMEYDHVADVPDFDFMETETTADSARFDRTVVLMHAAPFSDQFNNNVSKAFNYYLHLFPNLLFCAYGHDHQGGMSELYGDGLMFYGIDSASHRNYRIFTITPDGYEQYQVIY